MRAESTRLKPNQREGTNAERMPRLTSNATGNSRERPSTQECSPSGCGERHWAEVAWKIKSRRFVAGAEMLGCDGCDWSVFTPTSR